MSSDQYKGDHVTEKIGKTGNLDVGFTDRKNTGNLATTQGKNMNINIVLVFVFLCCCVWDF